jgi:DNA ligase-1
MLLVELVETSRRVAETTSRNEKVGLLADLLRRLGNDEIESGVCYLSGVTRQGRVGIGYASLREAMGAPAAARPSLEILDLDRAIGQIGGATGRGSGQRRNELLGDLFRRATAAEQQFLAGLLMGELRQGALAGLMTDAVAKAAGAAPGRVRRAVMMAGDVGRVAGTLLQEGEGALSRYEVELFRPMQPMLAQTAIDVTGALNELGEAALEYKFDGARVQVHRSGDDVAVYSRRMNDVTAAVPEIAEAARRLPAREFILDGEALTFDARGRPQPFQTTMRRFGRRLDVERMRAELPIRPVWFDVLYLDGGPLIDEPQQSRFVALERLSEDEFLAPHIVTADPHCAEEFARRAAAAGHEGIMAKDPRAAYAAGARGSAWLKIKQARTLDLVILAAEWGHGRRRGWLSNLHLGARDVEKGGFAMLGKTFKGLTDEMLAWQTQEFLKLEIARDSYTVHVEPRLVAEIAFNEIQVSPRYPSGLALRFARVKRYRPDKSAADADTFETVKQMAGMTP